MAEGNSNRAPQDVDEELHRIAFEEALKNRELALVHLRDARNLLYAVAQTNGNSALAKATVLMATAALETNLTYIAYIAQRFAEARPNKLELPQLDFLRGIDRQIDDNGRVVQRRARQGLSERMTNVPDLFARILGRRYIRDLKSAASRKMERTIERRDAIVHPRWDRNASGLGWWEAAEAVDAVELYLESVDRCLRPYLIGYATMLITIKGPTKHDLGVGHRTHGRKAPRRKGPAPPPALSELLVRDWIDSKFMVDIALAHGTDGDSDGSMLTRAALVFLYAMIDAQLSIVSQLKIQQNPAAFHEAEILFLNEVAAGVGHDGEVWLDSDQYPFKKRIKAIPAMLSRVVDGREFTPDFSTDWGRRLLEGYALRNRVVHSSPGETMPSVSKAELTSAVAAVRNYFAELARGAPKAFEHITILVKG